MRCGQGYLQRKGIMSLSFITQPMIALVGILCLVACQQELPPLYELVSSGSSFFIPSIPAINLFGFLPEGAPELCFTLGNLVDVFIDVVIVLSVGIIPYRWHKSAREPGIPLLASRPYGLLDVTRLRGRPSAPCSWPSPGLGRRPERGSSSSGMARFGGRPGGRAHVGDRRVPSNEHGRMGGSSGYLRTIATRSTGAPLAPKSVKCHTNATAVPLFLYSSIPSFYPRPHTDGRCAGDGRYQFLMNCRNYDFFSIEDEIGGWMIDDS